ncbi:MAG: DUF1330 domain-containing protein [Pseudomonadota bacterium]
MKLTSFLAATALSLAVALPTQAQDADAPVYLLANLGVENIEAYLNDYGFPVTPMLLAAGAEILVATPQVQTLEGEYSPNWSVVVRFPNQAAAEGWYMSDEYQAMIPVRHSLTDTDASTMVLAPQFVMPTQ